MKSIARFLVFALFALQLAACGGGDNEEPEPPPSTGGPQPNCAANPKACI